MGTEKARHFEMRLALGASDGIGMIAMLIGVLCSLSRMPQIVQDASGIHRPVAADEEAAEEQA